MDRATGGLSRVIERGVRGIAIVLNFLLFNIIPTIVEILLVAGILWWFIFNPTIGIMPYLLGGLGYDWNHIQDKGDAMTLVVIASALP